jgi:hypothetical protein
MTALTEGPQDTVASVVHHRSFVQIALLVCGILASVLWVGADIIASLVYPGYRYLDQAVSELSAVGAPTREFLAMTGPPYLLLQVLFAVGVVRAAGNNRALRRTGWTLVAFSILGVVAAFFPMNERGNGMAFTDLMHILLSGIATMVLILMAIGFGSTAFGRGWRFYSWGTIALFLAAGVWTAIDAPSVGAGLATPYMGLRERFMPYGYMLWMFLLALMLLRGEREETRGIARER